MRIHTKFTPEVGVIWKQLEGGRNISAFGKASIEDTDHNRDLLKGAGVDLPEEEHDPIWEEEAKGARRPVPHDTDRPPLWKHQEEIVARFSTARCFALFMEMGTAKTRIAIEIALKRFENGTIDQILVVAPKGVHAQWVTQQLPIHQPRELPYEAVAWRAGRKNEIPSTAPQRWFTINYDALRGEKGRAAAEAFLDQAPGRTMMILDESHWIKTHSAQRSKACVELGKRAAVRVLMSGTPLCKNLEDEWAQFKFLDERIIGCKYRTAFLRRYCIMGGFERREIIGYSDLEGFTEKIRPYSVSLKKADILDIPKLYSDWEFEISPEQVRMIDQLKKLGLTMIEDSTITTANAAALLTKIQQVTNGFIIDTESDSIDPIDLGQNPRLEALKDIVDIHDGAKIAVWCRFTHDILSIHKHFGPERSAIYYGATTPKDREEAIRSFLSPDGVQLLILNPAAGGTGLNLQGECRTNVYYSNGYNAADRWQSEDRTHRIGTTGAVSYIDLIANRGVDRPILRNLRGKKGLSDLSLSQLSHVLEEI